PSNSKESDLKKERTVARRRIRNPLLTSITVRQLKALLKSHNEEVRPGPSGVRVLLEAPPKEKPKRMVVRRAWKPSTDKRGRSRKKQF
uniref:SERTA domain-containing protein n=1 Tax=Parascaris univalens TaxID=6257 RepID=A0A914ZG63_PARUN